MALIEKKKQKKLDRRARSVDGRARAGPRPLKNKAAIARDQKVSATTVQNWMTDPRWTLGHTFPIDGEKIARWREETLREPAIGRAIEVSSARRTAEIQHRTEQTLLLRQKRALLENKYIERNIHDRAMVGLVMEFRRKIEDWLESLPPLFVGLSEVQIRSLFTDAYDRMCEDMMQAARLSLAGEEETAALKNQNKVRAAFYKHRED